MFNNLIIYFFIMSLGMFCQSLPSLSKTSDEIVRHIEGLLGAENIQATYKFVNHRSDGTTAEYETRMSHRHADRSHVTFLKPEREAGREVLRLGDDIWSFVPSVGRVVRIADRDSFAGGDFSNADILRIDWVKKYATKILKDLPNQWIIQLDASSPDAPYSRMRLWVDKKTMQPVEQRYYDSKGTLLKKCLYGNIKNFGDIERPADLAMENVITKQRSELSVKELRRVPSFPDSRFMIENLGK